VHAERFRPHSQGREADGFVVVQSSRFEPVINAQTARIIRINVLPTLLARADDVIE